MSNGDGSLNCEWCGRPFERPHSRGPVPRFCSRSHRQRAYEGRREAERRHNLAELDVAALREVAQRAAGIEEIARQAAANIDVTALQEVAQRAAGIEKIARQAAANIDVAGLQEIARQAAANIDVTALREVATRTAGFQEIARQAAANIDVAGLQEIARQVAANIGAIRGLEALEDLDTGEPDLGLHEPGARKLDPELVSAAIALMFVAVLVIYVLPRVIALAVAVATDAVETATLVLDLSDELAERVVEAVPGLRSALTVLGIVGAGGTARRLMRSNKTSGSD